MRPVDAILFALSAFIILLAGFLPLLHREQPSDTVEQECRLFYGPSGDAAVETCRLQMLNRDGRGN